ncbi:MAG: aminotransferase class V-fold PLP-dependent enzyme [Solirubrobacterales bacterium]|nr:aminotransferase class V-fold PLP-dependent enzyme [Solirubrobacterales bacterium]MBV9421358.1 aminotransferase class V-fold PLP-dependent enzyme [Solirubrobacterales bacterium]
MADPLADRDALDSTLEFAANEARRYVEALSGDPVSLDGSEAIIEGWSDPMPEAGDGSLAALRELAARGRETAMRSSGPRFFHFVTGGGTPAAIGADWLTSAYDQAAYAWASSPFAARLEQVAIDWLRQLFELPAAFGGVLTTGATMANFVALAAARNWWGERLGVDVEQEGIASLSGPLIASSGYLHPSAVQAIGMLGLGQGNIRRLVRDRVGRFDVERLDRELTLHGEPAIVIANAGEVNSGDFDPIEAIADVVERHHAWLHVDGAFGLFARLAPEARRLTAGIERADSVIADGHKWLNVPYDCGFAFVRQHGRLSRALNVGAPYLPTAEDLHPNFGFIAPENSRRARALAVWATLRAYGRVGYSQMVQRHLALAQHLADRVDAAPDLERLADVPLNIVCFRARPPGTSEEGLDELNQRLGEAVRADGRVCVGTTTYGGRVALRPAIVNWQTEERDVDLLVDVVRELITTRVVE